MSDTKGMTPTQIIQQWYDEHRADIDSHGIAGPPVDALMYALSPLFAAGPWRFDVENAPKDGSEILAVLGSERFSDVAVVEWRYGNWHAINAHYPDSHLIAFAIINPPEQSHVLGN